MSAIPRDDTAAGTSNSDTPQRTCCGARGSEVFCLPKDSHVSKGSFGEVCPARPCQAKSEHVSDIQGEVWTQAEGSPARLSGRSFIPLRWPFFVGFLVLPIQELDVRGDHLGAIVLYLARIFPRAIMKPPFNVDHLPLRVLPLFAVDNSRSLRAT